MGLDWRSGPALAALLMLTLFGGCADGDDDEGNADDDGGALNDDDDNDEGDDNNDDNNDISDDDDDDDNDDISDDDDDDNNDDDDTPLPQGVYVAKEGDDANAGTPDAPKLTIAAGLAAALVDGRPVYVAAGVYSESIEVKVELRGGYRYPDWSRDIAANETSIQSAAAIVVTMDEPAGDETLVEGFAITSLRKQTASLVCAVKIAGAPARLANNVIDQAATPAPSTDGICGVHVFSVGDVVIEDNVIAGLSGRDGGTAAGIAVGQDADVVIRRNTIAAGAMTGPWQAISAGLYVEAFDAHVLAAQNLIYAGAATSPMLAFSDGVEIVDGYVTLVGNLLQGATAAAGFDGGGISAGIHTKDGAEPPLLIGNTLRAGAAQLAFGAEFQTGATLVNNVFFPGNAAEERYALMAMEDAGGYTLQHNNLFCGDRPCGALGVLTNSSWLVISEATRIDACDWPGCLQAAGDICEDPRLAADDFHLADDSPCIDVGVNPSAWFSGGEIYLDLDGETRPLGWGWDIGADEAR